MNMESSDDPRVRWLLLVHQLPPTPAYLRTKIGRHLSRIGAVALKNSVYALPATPQAREDFAWVHREIQSGGGEGWVCEARFVEGFGDEQIEGLFHAARNAEYEGLAGEARALQKAFPRRGALSAARRGELEAGLARLEKRLTEVSSIDFFEASGRVAVAGILRDLRSRLAQDGGRALR